MMFSNVETIPALAAGTAPRSPAPAIALPAGPRAADRPILDWPTDDRPTDDWPTDDLRQGPDDPTVVAETPEAAPTREIPALAADAIDADQDRGTVAGREEPASPAIAAETANTETADTSNGRHRDGRHRAPANGPGRGRR